MFEVTFNMKTIDGNSVTDNGQKTFTGEYCDLGSIMDKNDIPVCVYEHILRYADVRHNRPISFRVCDGNFENHGNWMNSKKHYSVSDCVIVCLD